MTLLQCRSTHHSQVSCDDAADSLFRPTEISRLGPPGRRCWHLFKSNLIPKNFSSLLPPPPALDDVGAPHRCIPCKWGGRRSSITLLCSTYGDNIVGLTESFSGELMTLPAPAPQRRQRVLLENPAGWLPQRHDASSSARLFARVQRCVGRQSAGIFLLKRGRLAR